MRSFVRRANSSLKKKTNNSISQFFQHQAALSTASKVSSVTSADAQERLNSADAQEGPKATSEAANVVVVGDRGAAPKNSLEVVDVDDGDINVDASLAADVDDDNINVDADDGGDDDSGDSESSSSDDSKTETKRRKVGRPKKAGVVSKSRRSFTFEKKAMLLRRYEEACKSSLVDVAAFAATNGLKEKTFRK